MTQVSTVTLDKHSTFKWPSLAQDLAIMNVPGSPIKGYDDICGAYNITKEELAQVISIPQFQEMFKASLSQFKAEGNKASLKYVTTAQAQSLLDKVYRDMCAGGYDNKDILKFLEMLLKCTGIFDKPAESTVNIQNNVGVQLPLPTGLKNKKLDHLVAVN